MLALRGLRGSSSSNVSRILRPINEALTIRGYDCNFRLNRAVGGPNERMANAVIPVKSDVYASKFKRSVRARGLTSVQKRLKITNSPDSLWDAFAISASGFSFL
jgi:hypothetical protein